MALRNLLVGFALLGSTFAQQFSCPLWRGDLPNGYQDLAGKSCSNAATKVFTSGSTTARLYQIPGAWQTSPRYNEIVNGAFDAIKKGLVTFGSFVNTPLTIHVGIAWGGVGETVKVDDKNSGIKTPCYILFNFPADWNTDPITVLQKDLIAAMYQCVEQFHKPTVTTWTDGNKWWRRGIARYFDGLTYRAQPGFINRGRYPEEYQYGVPLWRNAESASLFFHFADQLAGWSVADVHNWMRLHPNKQTYAQERTSLSADTKITPTVWHKFILASIDGTIKYPTGHKIGNTNGGVPSRDQSGVVNIPSVGDDYWKSVSIDSFKGGINVFTIKGGQNLQVSVETEPGVEWSWRKVGTTAWNTGARTRTVNVAVTGVANVKYQLAISSTSSRAAGYLAKVTMKRVA
ncbi:hypothetical protein QBC35DRAFT_441653 [Podospora australis]|uniref:Uncharacterized protein n=1 Tax=Podospora australis TaxID=1536484 RepID=A0AAN7AEK6_9PEZI|nr:hypothetical protein QBC35DRAFT_441653 [Podospora australis]